MELIIVDGHSTDGTLQILRQIPNIVSIKCTILHENEGLGTARQIVVDTAKGKYIIWVDGDMILSENFVRNQVEFMEEHQTTGLGVGLIWFPPKASPILIMEVAPLMPKHYQNGIWDTKVTTKLPGTNGTISRVELLRNIGGFDKKITGAGEDQDIARKIDAAGWLICRTRAVFYETHGNLSSWSALWRKYFWYGSGSFNLYRRGIYKISILRMNPIAGLISGILLLPKSYLIHHRKIVFLCPLHFSFKMFAWLLGFIKAASSNQSLVI